MVLILLRMNTFNSAKQYFPQACSVTNSMASIRTFQRPEETLEESLVARGVNTEGYSFLGKSAALGTLNRGRSLHVANSKFYVKGKGVNENFEKHCSSRWLRDENGLEKNYLFPFYPTLDNRAAIIPEKRRSTRTQGRERR